MKKILIPTIILGAVLLGGCNKQSGEDTTTEPVDIHQVTKAQYERWTYDYCISNITSLNLTVSYTESVGGGDPWGTMTKFDNGKVFSHPTSNDFYVDFKAGTYNSENQTWSYDAYWYEDSTWKKMSFTNELIPDDIYFIDVNFFASYEKMIYNSTTNMYEQTENKITESGDIYSNGKVKFENGNPIYMSYDYEAHYELGKTYHSVMEVTDYGSTSVTLPAVE